MGEKLLVIFVLIAMALGVCIGFLAGHYFPALARHTPEGPYHDVLFVIGETVFVAVCGIIGMRRRSKKLGKTA